MFLAGEMSDAGVRTSIIKNFLLEQQDYRCNRCKIKAVWMGSPLILILDHKDGDSNNNAPDNVHLICSNCDSQLPTYKARNKGKGRASRRLLKSTDNEGASQQNHVLH